MSERGVFAVDRGIFEHPKFRDDRRELSRLEAWLWLLASAAWKPHTRRISGRTFELQRGQLVASTRYLAERWHWSEARVRRFLDALKTDAENDAEIVASTDAGITVITIRKYDRYQRVSLPCDAGNDAPIDAGTVAGATQERRNKEDKEYKEKDAAAAPTAIADPETELFRRGREVLGKQAGGMISKLLAAKNRNVALARAAIEQASTKSDPREYIGAILRKPATSPNEPNWLDGIPGVI